jgi:MFS family permease
MSPGRQRWTLIAVCFAQFMILLDVTIVNVALPSIQRELDVTSGTLVWTINAYALPLASFILVGDTLGDRYGRKRVFALGFVLFTVFSAGCALSTSDHMLIAFRALQGVGAALLAPLSLSILADAFEPERRAWAIGIWATIAGLGFGLGPVLGGALIEVFDWSAIFWVNVPIGIAGLLTTLAHVRESRDPAARRLDLGGAALASGTLFCLTLGLVETDDHAWTSAFTVSFLGAAAVLGAAFLIFEARHPDPMLPLDFFRRRAFTIANLDYCLMYAALAGVLFFVSLYFQNVRLLRARDRRLVADDERALPARLAVRRPAPGTLRRTPGRHCRRAPGGTRRARLRAARHRLAVPPGRSRLLPRRRRVRRGRPGNIRGRDGGDRGGESRCGVGRAQHRSPGRHGGRPGRPRIDRNGRGRGPAQQCRRLRLRNAHRNARRGRPCARREPVDAGRSAPRQPA